MIRRWRRLSKVVQQISHCCKYGYSNPNNNNNNNNKYSPEVMNQLKNDAMKFYKEQGPQIVELRTMQEWESQVVKSTTPVVLLCYAKWSEPCKQMSSVLEQRQQQDKNAWKLVRLDIDSLPQIATGLQINQLPTVILIVGGNSIDGMKGVPSSQTISKFFGSLSKFVNTSGQVWEEEQEMLLQLIEQNDSKGLHIKVTELMKSGKWNKYVGNLKLFEAYAYSIEGNWLKCIEILTEFETKYSDYLEEENVKSMYDDLKEGVDQLSNASKQDKQLAALLQQLDAQPDNMQLRYQISEYCYSNQYNQEAIQQLLDMIKIDRSWNDRKAQTMLLNIFQQLGSSNTLTIQARKQLTRILY